MRTPRTPAGWLKLTDARQNNLQEVTVDFPLGVLCVVAGVSGAGKSSLVVDTLVPLLARSLGDMEVTLPATGSLGRVARVEDVVLVDAGSVGRSIRSNAATYLKFYDHIRQLFAETLEAKVNGLDAGSFSFNTPGGRCERCSGLGFLSIDMKFLPDVTLTCPDCNGRRFEANVLEVKCRGRPSPGADHRTRSVRFFVRTAIKGQALIDVSFTACGSANRRRRYRRRMQRLRSPAFRHRQRALFVFEPTARTQPD